MVLGKGLTSVGWMAFSGCTSPTKVYFQGQPPTFAYTGNYVCSDSVTVFYSSGVPGWAATFDGRPTATWIPLELDLPSGSPAQQLILHTASPAPSKVHVQRGVDLNHWEI